MSDKRFKCLDGKKKAAEVDRKLRAVVVIKFWTRSPLTSWTKNRVPGTGYRAGRNWSLKFYLIMRIDHLRSVRQCHTNVHFYQ